MRAPLHAPSGPVLLLATALVLLPSPAFAQLPGAGDTSLLPERLYIAPTPVVGSTRVVALGGAFTGVAEGAQGFASNLASIAHRAPDLDRYWDWGLTLSWLDVPFFDVPRRDLDNDGRPDEARDGTQILLGALGQYRHIGVGLSTRMLTESYCVTPLCSSDFRLDADRATTTLAVGISLGEDDFIAAFGIYYASLHFTYRDDEWWYGDAGVEFDVLYRPHRHPWRFGVSVKPEVLAPFDARDSDEPTLPNGRRLYAGAVSPSVLSVGASFRLGRGAHLYNRLSPVARRDFVTKYGIDAAPPEVPPDVVPGPWLLTGQLDLTGGVAAAVPVSALLSQEPVPQESFERVGRSPNLTVRFGVEHETFPHRLRNRLGTYFEPSPFEGQSHRLHLTGGAELFLFHYWEHWSVSVSFDVARRYANVGLSLGFWR